MAQGLIEHLNLTGTKAGGQKPSSRPVKVMASDTEVKEALDDVLARHRREVKELTAKITALKKSVGGNKQKVLPTCPIDYPRLR